MGGERSQFGKQIKIIRKGVLRISDTGERIVGNTDKPIPPGYLDDLAAILTRAFANEFEGSEGKVAEEELLEPVRRKYPEEQPDEVCERTMPRLMAQGYSAKEIAEQLLNRNPRVKRALKLGDLNASEKDGLTKRLTDSILDFWPKK